MKTQAVTDISSSEAYHMIKSSKGRIFSVTFYKKNGDKRKLTGRTGVTKYLRGGNTTHTPEYYNVFDLKVKEYRKVNLTTIESLTMDKVNYRVTSDK